jgi:hypothetical protein
MKPFPADHAGRPNESCTVCHLPGPTPTPGAATETGGTPTGGETAGPSAIPHTIEGDTYKDCTTCHGIGKLKPFPENHTSFSVDSCTSCHKPAEGGATGGAGATPEAGATSEAGTTPQASATSTTGGATAGPAAIPHPIEGDTYKDCTTCHGIGKLKPFPENHTSFPADSCTGCHKPAEGSGSTGGTGSTGDAGAAAAAPIPANHDLTSEMFKDCTTCHGEGKLKPFPANHISFTVDQCQTCHKQAQ